MILMIRGACVESAQLNLHRAGNARAGDNYNRLYFGIKYSGFSGTGLFVYY